MSMTWNTTVTNQGIQLQTKQVQGSTLAFTRAVAGSGTVPVVNLKEQTAVSNIQQTLNIETVTMGVMQYVMNILLSNTNLQTGYNLSQVGLYATDPDVGEILFAIAQLDTPKAIPSYTDSPGYNLELSMTFANTQGANVTIVPDLAGYITQGAAQTLISNEVDPIQDNIVAIQHLGAKNLLPNTMTDVTISGCEFTVADDGTVTADGTASAYTYTAYVNSGVPLPAGTYTLSGCPEGGSTSTYYLQAFTGSPSSPDISYKDTGSGVTFTLDEETTIAVDIVINGTVSNLVFAPMIRPEAMADPTYEPYAMSNQEITQQIENLNVTVDVNMLATEWTAEASLGTITIERVRFLNGSYYAVGSAGAVFSSPDGKTWTNLNTTGISTEIEDIAYSENLGIYVALSDGRPYWSTNAVAWTLSDVDWNDDAIALCYGESSGNGIFVMTSQLYAWYSTDGKTWTQASITGTSAGFFREIAFAPDVNGRPMFVAVGDMGETMYSLNGRRWYEGGIVADTGLNTIAYAYGRFMISGNNSQYKVTYYSLDGLNWTEISDDIILYRIVAFRGIFVGFGQNNTIYTSLDGESWNLQGTIPSSVGTFNDISSAGELLFAHNNYQVTGILAYNAGMVSTTENVSDLSGLLNNILPNKEQIYKLNEQVTESAAAIDDLNTKAGQSTAISMFSFDENDNVVKTYDEDDKKTTEERLGLINETNVDAAMQGYTKNKTALKNNVELIAAATNPYDESTNEYDVEITLRGFGLPDAFYPASATYEEDHYLDLNTGKIYEIIVRMSPEGTDYFWSNLDTPKPLKTKDEVMTEVITSTDSETYLYRKSKAIGDREYLEYIDGGSLGWNQKATFISERIPPSQNGVTYNYTDGNSVKLTGTATADEVRSGWFGLGSSTGEFVEEHKYLLSSKEISGTTSKAVQITLFTDSLYSNIGSSKIYVAPNTANQRNVYTKIENGTAFTDYKITFICVDLTLALGSTIAEYVYSLEQATEGSGIAWLKEQGLFTDEYYAYDAGSIKSVNVSGHKMTGFNQWDEEWELGALNGITGGNYPATDSIRSKNYVPVFPNTTYYVKIPTGYVNFYGYDKDKSYIGYQNSYIQKANTTFTTNANTYFVRMEINNAYGTTYNHDICINISDSTKNGTYEPYEEHIYPITATDLLGTPQLTSDNKLGFDGDRYNANGRVDRKYGIVDLGSLSWQSDGAGDRFVSSGITSLAKIVSSWNGIKSINPKYKKGRVGSDGSGGDKIIGIYEGIIFIRDTSYNDPTSFKTAMSGVYLVYELATPTTENATPIINPQICSPYGTEEFISDSPVPVPHSTEYYKTPDWMDVEPLKSERKNNDSNTLKVAELANTRPELKSKTISGTTDANGVLDLYKSSNYRLIPICVITNGRHYVKLGSLTNQFGNVIYSRWTTIDPGSGSEIILANTAVSGTLYYYEL